MQFYKKNRTDQIWWVDNSGEKVGVFEFSFDRKEVFNLFVDYPQKLTAQQKEIFDRENPYWAGVFKDRMAEQFTARFGGRLFYAMPDVGYVYEYRGRSYFLEGSGPDPEAVMKASLEQGKNLLIKTFPVVDLYPDPKAVY